MDKNKNACSCGHCGHNHEEHHHDHSHDHDHSHGHQHSHEHACSCGACSTERKSLGWKELVPIIGAVVLTGLSLLIPDGIWRTLVLIAATLWVGWEMILEGLKGFKRFSLDEMTLMTIAVVAAFAIGEGFEGAMVTILFHIGELIENRAVQKGRQRIDALLSIVPENANLCLADGSVETRPAASIKVNETILIRAGERVPLDCAVLEGNSEADTSAVTGESQPVAVEPGSSLLSGMINLSGVLKCRVERDFSNSTASKIAQMVEEATEKKGKTEKFITRFAKVYTPVVVALALLLAVVPSLVTGNWTEWVHRALIFLVASCPCALVISVPLAFYSIIGASSRYGALIKGSQHIETLAAVRQVVFDKTGTLTTGKLSVTEILPVGGVSQEDVLNLAAACESASVHPIAQAVRQKAGNAPQPDSAEDIPGKGVKAVIQGKTYLCGSIKLLAEHGFSTENLPEAALYLADESQVLGAIRTGDTIRPEAEEAIQRLHGMGISRTVMLTGDREAAANRVRQQLGLTEARAELLPQDKVSAMEDIRKTGVSAFVGDGINDGPVLAAADAGFAMGMGSDLAAQAADVVLMNDKLTALPQTLAVCRKGMRVIRQNITGILVIKAAVLILGALGYAPMWAAVFADVGVTLLAVLSTMRIVITGPANRRL
ncbi:MAG TPA: cadmium-translocating P-type ATPase [Candidatus Merdivicinus excrementipullorum]|uniref:Cd(2+)-exporting ATPase n=1 Tax=Candidatus Merdivicinus excrementipullorum TaxID=2840867 RepID=A0A9D1FQB0_9FIRM|nr:cadmium-translocating P-type ATPase [Candidatus Merdivicinus excrementipullorum]